MKFKRAIYKLGSIHEKHVSKIERGILIKYHFFYKNYLKLIKGLKFAPLFPRNVEWMNTTLKTRKEVELAIKIIKKSNLNLHPDVPEKNWDSLIALNLILQNNHVSARILDAGGQFNSLILLWLYQFGYFNLKCLNLIFNKKKKRGKIKYIPGDITNTYFPDNYFEIITCLSVIEHGVNEDIYLEEMYRILKKNGLLIISTDYWENKVDTNNLIAYNNPIFIYDKNSINKFLNKAYIKGFKLFGPNIDLSCQKKLVYWKQFDLKYTFLTFCLQKNKNR